MKITLEKLTELRNANPPRFNWRAYLVPKEKEDTHEKILGNDVEVLDKYFSHFTEILDDSKCIGCGERQGGGPVEYLVGIAKFRWGIIHGEGYCNNCGWPARAIHYKVGPIARLEMILQYHPAEVKLKDESPASV